MNFNIKSTLPFFGHLLAVCGQFAMIKVLAANVEKGVFGEFALMLAVAALVNIFMFGPLVQWAVRYYREYYENKELSIYYASLMLVVGVFLLIICCFTFIFYQYKFYSLNALFGISGQLVALGFVLGLIVGLNDLCATILNAAMHPVIASTFFAFNSWMRVIAIILAFFVGIRDLNSIVEFMLLALCIMLFLQTVVIVIIEKQEIKNSQVEKSRLKSDLTISIKSMVIYLSPFILWSVPGYFVSMGDRWILAKYADTSIVGTYAAMALVSMGIVGAFVAAANKMILPILFKKSGSGLDGIRTTGAHVLLSKITTFILVFFCPLVLLYSIFSEEIIILFTSKDYTTYHQYLWILLIAAVFFHIGQILITHGLIKKKPWEYVPIKILHGILVFALFVFLVPDYLIFGVALSLFISNILYLIAIIVVNKRIVN